MHGSKRGTFLVTEVDDDSAVLTDVADAQVHPLSANPDLEPGDIVEGEVTPDPPMHVTWTLTVDERRRIDVDVLDEPPGSRANSLARMTDDDDPLATRELADGELHVIAVPADQTDETASEIAADDDTRRRAARLAANRVEIRAADGVVAVRYLVE